MNFLQKIFAAVEKDPATEVEVNLEKQTIRSCQLAKQKILKSIIIKKPVC